ncbi:MAG TPA: protein kinase, partial [Vicinamibacterales bacterium]|nr:protein kinase [Vicinamibacterales bacterium]
MALAPGTRVGSYEVIARIGAGGMGEVYRARDAKLNRDVALKILPDAFMLDGDRIARFRREAQVLASLSHANIAAIYGFEDSGSTHALVLELVDGPTLADRIAEGPVPVDEALPIAEQIAEALEAAHEQGIIHRDLKPANIKLRGDGTVKVLDFGLAKALEPASAINPALTASPTITSPAMMTGVGMLLGTAAYMSPEQAKGRPADKRSDVWAFGCVLYEMLTGKRAFAGDDVVDIFAAVLRTDPDWNAIPVGVGERTRALLRRCLERDRNRRVSDASVVRFVLAEPEPSAPAAATSPPPTPWWRRLVSMAALLVIAGGVIGTVFLSIKRSPELPVTRFRITLPDGQQFAVRSVVVAVSPDGRRIAYAGRNGAASLEPRQVAQLYLRSLADADAHPIPGTNLDVMSPFFSPDGQWIGFYSFQDSTFKKVAVGGGAPVTICHADAPFGVTWDGEWIVFADQGAKGILRVSQDGCEPHVL